MSQENTEAIVSALNELTAEIAKLREAVTLLRWPSMQSLPAQHCYDHHEVTVGPHVPYYRGGGGGGMGGGAR